MGWDEKPDNKYIDEMIPLLKQLPDVMQMQMLAMVKVLIIQQDGNEEKFIKSILGEDDETTK